MSEVPGYNPDARREVKKVDRIKLGDFDRDFFNSLEGENGWIALGQEYCTNQRYFTVFAEDGTKVGIVGVYDTEDDQNITHTVIDPKYRGQGLAAKCKDALMNSLNLPFVTLTISLDNTPSLKAAEKLPGVQKVSDAKYEADFHKAKFIFTRAEKNK
ncbi:MAG: GNAT family N-acetyltransferase [Patescibacteria group bacterium]